MEIPSKLIHLRDKLEGDVRRGKFTAWSVATQRFAMSVFNGDEAQPSLLANTGSLGFHPSFDIASLTKPLLGVNLVRRLFSSQELKTPLADMGIISQNLERLCCLFQDGQTLQDLLNHSSGLPSWFWFPGLSQLRAKKTNIFETLLRRWGTMPLSQQVRYSDLGYFLLAQIVKEKQGEAFKEDVLNFLQSCHPSIRYIPLQPGSLPCDIPSVPFAVRHDAPWQMSQKRYDVLSQMRPIHDLNLDYLNNTKEFLPSFHSGLRANILGVVSLVEALNTLFQGESYQNHSERFFYGLDTPTSSESTAGWGRKDSAIGHYGYTGTTFWLKPGQAPQFHILLTNRTATRREIGVAQRKRICVFTLLGSGTSRYFSYDQGVWQEENVDNDGDFLAEFAPSGGLVAVPAAAGVSQIADTRKLAHEALWRMCQEEGE